jgi:hypothetical protein
MPRTGWTPSIVPKGDDQNVYDAACVTDGGPKATHQGQLSRPR